MNLRRSIAALLLGAFLAANALEGAKGAPAADRAEELLASMSPEERVGQLLLVGVDGVPRSDDPIYEFVRRGRVSGVVLRAENGNFAAAPGTAEEAWSLIRSLQEARVPPSAEVGPVAPSGDASSSAYVPLLVGISLNRQGDPYPEISGGLSESVTEMALGATWDPELARQVGAQIGREYAALGFNLILGPSLDVLDETSQGSPGDLGAEAFGGDPYWVSEMGNAFVAGLHLGAGDRIAVVAKHFPGTGGSDRPPGDEVATVRKSLDTLRLVDLAPFFAVTSGTPGEDPATVDGLLLSHIRYQGLQGNIRQATRPVSLDRAAVAEILSLDPLPAWRAGGGVVIADSLGSRAVRRFYDPAGQAFNGPLVAREAFLAGSDLLILDDFVSSGDPDETMTLDNTIAAFVNRYQEDPVFAEQVDEAALRVLRLKLRLYGGTFEPEAVLDGPAGVEAIEPSAELAFRVARRAASRISPAGVLTPEQLGEPPSSGDRLVMFTDELRTSACPDCPSEPILSRTALEETITDLYGPRAGGQARGWNLTSYSMADLAYALGERPPADPLLTLGDPEEVLASLEAADWIVFSLLSTQDGAFGSDSLRLLLDRSPEHVQGKRVVAFAFDVPYELDATDLSKIDLFYALYAPADSFVNTAARLLFQEAVPGGAAPVTVPGVGYDLLQVLSPDPAQTIGLELSGLGGEGASTEESGFIVGDAVLLQTGVLVDGNGHPVPDGTPVEFHISFPGEALTAMLEATTVDGIAQASMTLDRVGLHSIRASSDPARISNIIELDVQEGVPAFATVITPTAAPTPTAAATDTAAAPTEAVAGGGAGAANPTVSRRLPSGSILVAIFLAGGAFTAGFLWVRRTGAGERDAIRAGAIGAIGALLAFNYMALGFPGSAGVMASSPLASLMVAGVVGGAAGVAFAVTWWRRGWTT